MIIFLKFVILYIGLKGNKRIVIKKNLYKCQVENYWINCNY